MNRRYIAIALAATPLGLLFPSGASAALGTCRYRFRRVCDATCVCLPDGFRDGQCQEGETNVECCTRLVLSQCRRFDGRKRRRCRRRADERCRQSNNTSEV